MTGPATRGAEDWRYVCVECGNSGPRTRVEKTPKWKCRDCGHESPVVYDKKRGIAVRDVADGR